jgi:hypothetical protein
MKKALLASAALLAVSAAPALASGFNLPVFNVEIAASYGKFSSNHTGNGTTSGATNLGTLKGKAEYGGLSQVGTATNSVLQRDKYGNPVYDNKGNPLVITNPAGCGCMTGTSGSQVGGSAGLTTGFGNVSGSINANSYSAGSAEGFTIGGSISTISSLH